MSLYSEAYSFSKQNHFISLNYIHYNLDSEIDLFFDANEVQKNKVTIYQLIAF